MLQIKMISLILIFFPITLCDQCVTPECINVASDLLSFMNPAIDPCEDFYEAACGKYTDENHFVPLRPFDGFRANKKKIDQKMMEVFISDLKNSNLNSEKTVGDFFESCKKQTDEDLKDELKSLFSPFYTPDAVLSWPNESFSIISLLSKITRLSGKNGFFNIGAKMNEPNLSLHLEFSRPNFDHLERKSFLKKTLSDVFSHIFQTPFTDIHDQKVDEVFDFKDRLKKFPSDKYKLDSTSDFRTENSLKNEMFFNKMLDLKTFVKDLHPRGSELFENAVIESESIFYFHFLGFRSEDTKKETLGNYIVLSELFRWIVDLEKSKKSCESFILEEFPVVVGLHYSRKTLNIDNAFFAKNIFHDILSEYEKLVSNSNWMSLKLKSSIAKLLQTMSYYIGSSQETSQSIQELEDSFKKLSPKTTFFGKLLNLRKVEMTEMLEYLLSKKIPNFIQKIHISTTKYFLKTNVIGISSLILQKPFLDYNYPPEYNFGSFGAIVASQIGKLNHYGKHSDVSWDQDMEKNWLNVSNCYKSDFDLYYSKLEMNDEDYLRKVFEKFLAEQIGFIIAYNSYKNRIEDNLFEIPGTSNFTNDQIFFYRFAQRSCAPEPTKKNRIHLKTASIPIAKHVINTAVKNSKEFSQAFHCSKTSAMNINPKCNFFMKKEAE